MKPISAQTKICIIIGDPVKHSLSPAMHNAAYTALGIDDKYVFLAAEVRADQIEDAIRAVKVFGIHGMTCTVPHKENVMTFLDEIDPIAEKIGAVNTVVNNNGMLKGYNTDWLGTVVPLENAVGGSLRGKTAGIIGAGGAARAMAYGLYDRKASLIICNRSFSKAETLAKEIGSDVKAITMDQADMLKECDIILNATTIGMAPNYEQSPINPKIINKTQIVFDAVYSPRETTLLKYAKNAGATVIYGTEMLLYQGIAQFKIYTGLDCPAEVMRDIIQK